jgi:hypothetical protein
MKLSFSFVPAVAAVLMVSLYSVSAHLSVSGDRTLNGGAPIDNLTVSNTNRTVSSSFGWADGTDANWGDSHRLTAFKFTIGSTQDVSITVQRRNAAGQTGLVDTLLPAFSLFNLSGTFVASTHDSGPATVAYLTGTFGSGATAEAFTDNNSNTLWDPTEPFTDGNANLVWDGAGLGGSGKEGAFRALTGWRIYKDAVGPTDFMDFNYLGHGADGTYGSESGINGDGSADGSVSATFNDLVAGDYYFLVGGADYAAQNTDPILSGSTRTFKTYGIAVTVSAVPEPTAAMLFALVAGGWALARRSRRTRR